MVHIDASNVFHHYEMPASLRGANFKQKSQAESVVDSLGRAKIMQLFMKNTFEVIMQYSKQYLGLMKKITIFGFNMKYYYFH